MVQYNKNWDENKWANDLQMKNSMDLGLRVFKEREQQTNNSIQLFTQTLNLQETNPLDPFFVK